MEKTKLRDAGVNIFGLVLFAVVLGMITACATSPDITSTERGSGLSLEWERVYGGEGDDYGQQAIATADGGYLLMGTTQSEGLEYIFKDVRIDTVHLDEKYGELAIRTLHEAYELDK